MKKTLTCLLALILVLTCVFAMTACKEDEDPKKESEAESEAEDTSSIEDTSAEGNSSVEDTSSAESQPEGYQPAEGYKLYTEDGFSFAYPENWVFAPGATVSITGDDGNNIALTYEAASEETTKVYESLSKDTFMELLGNVFEAMGMQIGEYDVKRETNGSGVEIIRCEYSLTFEDLQMKMYQFIVLGEETHYTVTVCEVTDISHVADEVFKSIALD